MKKMRKAIALIVALVMAVSMLSLNMTVSAEESAIQTRASNDDAMLGRKLKTLGVITNEFELTDFATRGEMASVAAKFAGIPTNDGKQIFSDVSPEHMYYGAISALYNMGVVTGDGTGKFNPDEYVTYDEAMVYIINVVGHKPFAMREGGYPTGYHRIAIKYKMLENLAMNKGTDKITFADIYKMLDKALSAATVDTSYYGDGDITYTLSETETFLSQNYKIRQKRGIVTAVEGTRLISVVSAVKADQIEINNHIYDLDGYSGFDLLGRSVDFYVNETDVDTILYIEETVKRNETIKIDADDLLKNKTTDQRIYYEDENYKEYHIDLVMGFAVIYNNQCYDTYGVLSTVLPDNGYVEALDNNRDGIYDVLFVFEYRNVVVDSIDSYDEAVRDKITGEKIDLSGDNQIVEIRFVDQKTELNFLSIQNGDILTIAESLKTPKVKSVYISRLYAEGRIEAYDSEKGFYIGGEWYEAASDALEAELQNAFSSAYTGRFYLDLNGEITYYDNAVSEKTALTAVMSGIDYEIGNFGSKISVRLFTEKGEFLHADLKEKVKIGSERFDLSESADVTRALGTLATAVPGGEYVVDSAYVVCYELSDEGKISYLDLGRDGGPGKLNVLATGVEDLFVRVNYICSYTNNSGEKIRQRYDADSGIAFGVPADGNLDDLENYSIITITQDRYYKNASDAVTTRVNSADVYTYQTSETAVADVILLRGAGSGAEVSSGATLDVIESITTVSNEDGERTYKLYMGGEDYILSPELYFSKGGATPVKVTADSLVANSGSSSAELQVGIAVQFNLNSKKEISAIRIIAKYDEYENLIPMFGASDTYVENTNFESSLSNVVVGVVSEYDYKAKQLYFTTPGSTQTYFLYTVNDSVSIYRNENGRTIVTEAKLSDIAPGDKIVASLERYYVPNKIILFK